MRWVGHVAHGRDEKYVGSFGHNVKERDHLKDLGVDGKILLVECILRKLDEKMWTGFVWFGIGASGG
jgi:hypothetical protein